MKNRIRHAINVNLSGMYATKPSRAAIMQRVHGGVKAKKKLSLGLILALALTLLVIGALAAVLLAHKEFVDEVLAPKASENASDMWTQEEMNDILRTALENGVTLSEDVIKRLEKADAGYKEEIMRAFVKEELGFYPSTWSIEDQAWYDQLLVDCGLYAKRTRFVPEGDEITQQQALDIALAYIREHFDAKAAVTEPTLYRRHMGYQAHNDNLYSKGRQWTIEYEPLDNAHSCYTVILLSDGTVKDATRDLGPMEEGRPALRPYEVQDMYMDQYGAFIEWTMETWISFHDALAAAAKTYGIDESAGTSLILRQTYALADDKSIPRQAAIDAAIAAIAAAGGPDDKALRDEHDAYAIYLLSGDGPVWKVSLTCHSRDCGVMAHMAEVNAYTGKVLNTDTRERGGPWYTPYILKSLIPVELPATPASTPRADGKPRIWYSDIAPSYYWEALDALGYTGETASELMDRWHAEYGNDNLFWPLAQRAVDILWHELGEGATVLPGLPAPDDVQQEKALEIAWQALRANKAQTYDASFMDSLKAAVSFTFNTPSMGGREWLIQFAAVTPTDVSILEHVAIDAATGNILSTSWDAPPTPAPTPAPRPDGKPAIWYSSLAPDYFWQALDDTGYHGESPEEYGRQCEEKYGADRNLWPLEAQAIIDLWNYEPGFTTVISGLPAPEDIKREEAIELS